MEIDELAVKITGDSTSLQGAMRDAQDVMGRLGVSTSALTGLLGAAGLTAAFKMAYEAASKMVAAYRDDEVAQLKYNAALAASTAITAQGKRALDAYVPVFASLAGIAEADTQAQIARLAAYGRTDAQIKMMMETALGMSTVLDMDVNTALTQLNMTFQGTAGRLGQQVSGLKDLTAEQLKNGEGLKFLNGKYGEFSGTLKNSTDVSIKNFENAWSDLMSTMGQSIAVTIQPLRDSLTGLFKQIIKEATDTDSTLTSIAIGFNNFVNIFKQGFLSLIGQGDIFAAIDEAANHTEQKIRNLIALYASIEDSIQKRIRLEKEAEEKARQEAQKTADAAIASNEAVVAAQIKGRKDAQKAYDDTISQINTKIKLGVVTEQQAADAKYAANQKLIDDLIALGYTGAIETGFIGDKALADAVARNKVYFDNTAEGIAKLLRIYGDAVEIAATYVKTKILGFKETAEAEKAEAEVIAKAARAAESASTFQAVVAQKYIRNKQDGMKAARDLEQSEIDAIENAKRADETALIFRGVIASRFVRNKILGIKEIQAAEQAETDALALQANTIAVASKTATEYVNNKKQGFRELRDVEQAETDAIQANLSLQEYRASIIPSITQAYLNAKKQGFKELKEGEQAETDAIAANLSLQLYRASIIPGITKSYLEAKKLMLKEARDAEQAEADAIDANLSLQAYRASLVPGITKDYINGKKLGYKESRDAEQEEFNAIEANLTLQAYRASIIPGIVKSYIDSKKAGFKENIEGEKAESEAIEANLSLQRYRASIVPGIAKEYTATKMLGFKEVQQAEQAESDAIKRNFSVSTELIKRKLVALSSEESRITQIAGTELEKRTDGIKQQLAKDLELNKDSEAVKKALIEQAGKDILAVQAETFTQYASMALGALSQMFSGIGSLISAQADSAVDAVEKRLESLRSSWGDTASSLQTMYDALEKMGATDKAATIKAQLDKEKAVEDYASLSMDQLASLYATAIEMGDSQTAAEITAAQARVKAEKDAAEEIKQIKYQAAVAEWNMKLMSTTASAAQAVMDAYNSLISIPVVGPVLAPIAATAAGAFGIVQIAAVAEAKPKLDTGGVIRARDDTSVTVGRGTGEVMFGTGALGDPLMQGFADLVASRVSGSGGYKTLLPVQIVLKDRVIAESTVELIDNGQVRFTKPLKVAAR